MPQRHKDWLAPVAWILNGFDKRHLGKYDEGLV